MKQFISMILCQLFIHGLLAQTAGNADSLHQRLNQVSGSEQVEVLIKLSELHRNTMFADCIDYGRKAISLSQEIGASELEAQASKSMGISYYMAGKLDEALDFYLKSLAISESIRDTVGMANCTNNIGLVYEEWADFERAIKYYQRSFELEKELNNRGGMAISLIQMGNIHYYQQDLQEALDVFYQAMIHFIDIGDFNGKALAYNSLGVIYKEWGEPEKALECYKLALDAYGGTDNIRALSHVLTNLGQLYANEYRDYRKALSYYEQSLFLKKKMEDEIGIALLNNNLGSLYASMEDVATAQRYYMQSRHQYEAIGSEIGLVMVDFNRAELMYDQEMVGDAIALFKQSLKMASENGHADYIKQNFEALLKCFVKQGNINEYEIYQKQYAFIQDSLTAKLEKAQWKEVEAKYKLNETERMNDNVLVENEARLKELRQYRLLLAGFGGGLILLMFVYVLFLKIRK